MATNEGSDNNMEFFFTLNATPELQNQNTIFGESEMRHTKEDL
jgi:cyclophilin family peptidyl-prolyl cis-trans isomerase